MAESVTFTDERDASMQKAIITVVSAADGTADGTSTYAYSGQVVRFIADPDAGATQPTASFDIVVNDGDGFDILTGNGANLSNAASTTVVAGLGAVANDRISLSATNMGDSKGATFYVYVKP